VAKPVKLTAAERRTLKRLLAKSGTFVETPLLKGGEGKTKNTGRAFWTDGTHAYLRRKKANPGIIERTDGKVRRGEYRHVKTSDDVEIYEISDDSPLRRKKLALTEMTDTAVERSIVVSACERDWKTFYDAVGELSYRYKNGGLPQGTSELILQQTMQYLHLRISRRGGPSPGEIGRELAGVRKSRTGSQVFLPPASHLERH
jgi:hypothetical protein